MERMGNGDTYVWVQVLLLGEGTRIGLFDAWLVEAGI